MGKTNDFFIKGKISAVMDGGAGSSGKGKIASFIADNADNFQFVCNTFFPQASHTCVHGGKTYVYKQLNSCAHIHEKFQKMYIGHGSVIDVQSLLKEIGMSGLPKEKLGIAPNAVVLQAMDKLFEEGKVDFDGEVLEQEHDGTIKFGSTCSGVGAARARKTLRRPNIILAKDVPELQPYICDVGREIIERLSKGQSGLLEIAQGFQLSYGLPEFFPYTTSRNCTLAAALDDMMLPPTVIGNVCINFRTYPIRIHSYKYIANEDQTIEYKIPRTVSPDEIEKYLEQFKTKHQGAMFELITGSSMDEEGKHTVTMAPTLFVKIKKGKHLTWDEVQEGKVKHDKIESYSGDGYPDQRELTWEKISEQAGMKVMECTTLTKLPRRIFTPSKMNIRDSILFNQTPNKIYISLNFVNYVAGEMYRRTDHIDGRVQQFIAEYFDPIIKEFRNVELKYLGTSEHTEDTIIISDKPETI